jgi:hypothetical protein
MGNIDAESIEKLLLSVNAIVEKYDKVAQQTGVNFNIFNVLNIRSQEVKHSAFITELLNPKGQHGYGERFLELFLEEIGLQENKENLKNASVEAEKIITNNRRIDIYAKIPNRTNIIIENKIYATDQENQLRDYHEFDTNAIMLYLTLWGNPPSPYSTGNLAEESLKKVKTISYKEHIKNWLEKCLKEPVDVDKPFIHENITQYLNIVKELTHQSNFNEMKEEILQKLRTDAEMARGFYHLITNVSLEDWYKEVFGVIKSRLNFYEFNEENTDESRGIFNFWRYKKEDDFCIFLEANKDGHDMRVGVAHLDIQKPSPKNKEILRKLHKFQTDANSNEWICYKEISSWNNTSWTDFVSKIDEISEEIQGVIDEIIKGSV